MDDDEYDDCVRLDYTGILHSIMNEINLSYRLKNGHTFLVPYDVVKRIEQDSFGEFSQRYRTFYERMNLALYYEMKDKQPEYERYRITFSGYPGERVRTVSEVFRDTECENQFIVVSGVIVNDVPIEKFHSEEYYECPACNSEPRENHFKGWIRNEYQTRENITCSADGCNRPLRLFKDKYKVSNFIEFYISSFESVFNIDHEIDLNSDKLKCFYCGEGLEKLTFGKSVILSGYIRFIPSLRANDTSVIPLFFVTNVESVCDPSDNLVISDDDAEGIKRNRERSDFNLKIIRSVFPDNVGAEGIKYALLLQMMPVAYDCSQGEKSELNSFIFGSPSTGKSVIADYGSLCRIKHKSASMQMGVTVAGLTCGSVYDPHTGKYITYSGTYTMLDYGGVFVGHEVDKAAKSIQKTLYQPLQENKFAYGKVGDNKNYLTRECYVLTGNTVGEEVDMSIPLVEQIELPKSIMSRVDIPFIILPFGQQKNEAVFDSKLTMDSRRMTESKHSDDDWDSDTFTIVQVQKILKYMSGFNSIIPKEAAEEFKTKSSKRKYILSMKGLFSGRLSGSLYLLSKKIANWNFRSKVTAEDIDEAAGILLGEKGLTVHTTPELLELYASDFTGPLKEKGGLTEDEFVECLKDRFAEDFVRYLLCTADEDSIILKNSDGKYVLNGYKKFNF